MGKSCTQPKKSCLGGQHYGVGHPRRPKNAFSSETDKTMLGTTFSHYLGIKQCRKPKIENFYTFFHPVQALRSFTT